MSQLVCRLFVLSLGVAAFARALTSTISTMLTGPVGSTVAGLVVDPSGSRYLAIVLPSDGTEPGKLIFGSSADRNRGILVQKITRDGVIVYSSWLSGIADVGPTKLAVNEAGELFLAGVTRASLSPTPGALA